jgi:hypothetical protein
MEKIAARRNWHVLEFPSFFRDTIFVMGPFSLTGTTLSDRIYKICTPLSTGFVENIHERRAAPARKTRPGAGFRGGAHPHWRCGR